jgi:tripartite-type tricarboxylate transporter receptor subunit TctC
MANRRRWLLKSEGCSIVKGPLIWLAFLVSFVATAAQPRAQTSWPTFPIKIILGFPAGGTVDMLTRELTPAMSQFLGVPVIIENRPGGAQMVAALAVANAAPDGYTIGIIDSATLTIAPHTRAANFDPIGSLTPIGLVANLPLFLVAGKTTGITNLDDLVRLAKDKPGTLSYATPGVGSLHHIAGEFLKAELKLDMLHIPYRGAGPALADVIGGTIPLAISGLHPVIRDGQVVAIGIASSKRSLALPQVPTLIEQGAATLDVPGWIGLFGPAGLPQPAATALNAALKSAVQDKALIQKQLTVFGNELQSGSADELKDLLAADYNRWGKLVRERGLLSDQ